MANQDGLVSAYLLDGEGGGATLDWDRIRAWRPGDGVLWVHLDWRGAGARRWLRDDSAIGAIGCDALIGEEATRSRSLTDSDHAFVHLRGANLNLGARPEDMVELRLWLEAGRVVSTRHRHVMAIEDLRDAIDAGHGPRDAGDLLAQTVAALAARLGPVIANLDDAVDALETDQGDAKSRLADLRRRIIELRRHVAPERDALAAISQEPMTWLAPHHRRRLAETTHRVARYVEDLDAARERALVSQEELAMRLNEQMSRNTYVLSVVAALVLPASFVAALLGVNLGGIPGSDHPWGFWILCAGFVVSAGLLFILFRRLKWL